MPIVNLILSNFKIINNMISYEHLQLKNVKIRLIFIIEQVVLSDMPL